ncbi:MAG: globin [Planctomycetota bacterium]|nr:globin [Planctomycetota bacterium]MDA0932400.1 globin [Planctomycetota bacterium]MDA1221876.1 globin [Planctomycetota bacterium]
MQAPQDPVGFVVAAVGEDAIARLVAAFYRDIASDDVLGPMYPPDDLAGAETRLRDFLVERFGGPPLYTSARGHPRLRMRHARFPVDVRARDRWVARMDAALDEVAFPEDVDRAVRGFLAEVATFLVNR